VLRQNRRSYSRSDILIGGSAYNRAKIDLLSAAGEAAFPQPFNVQLPDCDYRDRKAGLLMSRKFGRY